MSNISTVSDDSQPDSGYDHSNWVSKLAALSEIEESDYEVIPKLSWAEIHASNDQSTIVDNDDNADVESVSNPNEMMSREDWDRILRVENKPLDISLVQNLSTTSEETLKERTDIVNTQLKAKPIRKKASHLPATPEKERTSSWLSNIFRKPSTSTINDLEAQASNNDDEPTESKQTASLVVIPEVEEMRISEENVSRSFDDNCDFERAEECDEEKEESIEIN